MKTGIVAFAFGVPATIASNKLIASIASKLAREINAPIYTQADVCVETGIRVKYTTEMQGDPPPTLRIARGAVDWAKANGFETLYVIAAEPHIQRCIRDLRYAVAETRTNIMVLTNLKRHDFKTGSWFCLDSTQPRTRSLKAWRSRERILEKLPMWLYKLIAS